MNQMCQRTKNDRQESVRQPVGEVVDQGQLVFLERRFARPGLLAGLLIVVCIAVLATHWPALSARAMSFDDAQYLTHNKLVQHPSWESAGRFLGEVLEPSTVGGYYQPLAMISLMLDCAMGGTPDNLRPFHRTSLALHVANTALVVLFLHLLFGRPEVAAGVGLLFALHPMTVEPIPWVGERKTLLAAFFALWCLILYVRYVQKGRWGYYIAGVVVYLMALMSKPTSTTLPACMLLLDFWPLRRLKWSTVLEKLPLLLLGGVFAVITYESQRRTGGMTYPTEFGPVCVPLIFSHNIIFYLYKIIWPVNLTSHYAFPDPLDLSHPMVMAGVIGTCMLIPLLLLSLRWTRGILAGWLFFFLAILPTMQILRFSNVIASDKFAYLPSIGLLMVLALLLSRLYSAVCSGKPTMWRTAGIMILLMAVGAEAIATRRYLRQWRDTVTLCKHMLTQTPHAASVYAMLGYAFSRENKLDQAAFNFAKAVECSPDDFQAYDSLGNILAKQEKIDQAIEQYLRAIQLKPDYAPVHNNLGNVLISQGRLNMAIKHFYLALQFAPDYALAHSNLGIALQLQGRSREALRHFRVAIQLQPAYAKGHYNLAITLHSQGRFDEALNHYLRAIQLEPLQAKFHYRFGLTLRAVMRLEESIKHFRESVRLNPDYVEPLNSLAWLLATHTDENIRDGDEALRLAKRAAELTGNKDANILDTLAAGYGAVGQYKRAARTAELATKLASVSGRTDLANAIRERLELYRKGHPYREPMSTQRVGPPELRR